MIFATRRFVYLRWRDGPSHFLLLRNLHHAVDHPKDILVRHKNHHELLGAEKNVEAASAPILLVVGFYLRDKVAVDSKQFTIEYDLRKITSTTRVN